MIRLLVVLLALLAAQPARSGSLELVTHWRLLAEPGATWRLEQALAHESEFRPASSGSLAPGYTDRALWASLELPEADLPAGSLQLMMRMPRLERVSLWQQDAEGRWREQVAGVGVPHAQWPLDTTSATFSLQRPSQGQALRVVMRQAGRTAPSWDALLCTPQDCRVAQEPAQWISALMIGGQLLVAAGCLALLVRWRQAAFALLAAYALIYSLYEFTAQGWGFQVLWPHATDWATRALNVETTLVLALQSMCVLALLRRAPRGAIHLLACVWGAQAVLLCGSLWGDYRALAPATNGVNSLLGFITLGLAVWGWRARLPQGGMIALAASLTIAGGAPRYMHIFGLMSHGKALMLATPALVLATTALMVWALVERMAAIHRARLQAQEQVLAERALRERELQGLVSQRTAELSDALAHARSLNQQRTRLLAYIGHDLRVPLGVTLGCLRELKAGQGSTELHQARIEQVVAYQLALIEDLLDFSRDDLQSLDLMPQPVYAWSLLLELAAQGELLALHGNNRFVARFEPDLPGVVMADARRLRQLLLNLLSNAAKFTRAGRIEFSASLNKAGRWCFEVSDEGPGIATQDRQHLFEPFWQRAASPGSSGLGLAIVRHLVEAMAGTITVSSSPGRGSSFRVELALPEASAEAVFTRGLDCSGVEPLASPCRTLLIDGPQAHADRVAEILFAAGCAVEWAQDWGRLPDAQTLLLCDPELLDERGQVLLKRWPGRRIALLARPLAPALVGAFDAGLYKPVDATGLFQALKQARTPGPAGDG